MSEANTKTGAPAEEPLQDKPTTGTSRAVMALSQLALGLFILLAWHFASGRLVDKFFISGL